MKNFRAGSLRLPSALAGKLLILLLAVGGTIEAASQAAELAKASVQTPASGEAASAKSLWNRIVIIGASASAGFTESEPFGGPRTEQFRFSRYLDAALLTPHEPIKSFASALFFLAPELQGQLQIGQATNTQPTLVVGIDFLFWFCYGGAGTDEQWLKRFESGLKLLEAVSCPLVLGDIPDASSAIESGMLRPDQVPNARTRSAANQRLKKWAASRNQVIVLELSNFMRTAMANEALTLHGKTLPAGKTRGLLQSDQLHPNSPGCAALAVATLDALQSAQPGLSASDIRWNPGEVLRVVLPARKPENSRARTNSPASAGNPPHAKAAKDAKGTGLSFRN